MSFLSTSSNVQVIGVNAFESILMADCQPGDLSSSLLLDAFIGNIDGALEWGYKGFSTSARNVRWEDNLLQAELQTIDGEWVSAELDLNTNIANENGKLTAVNIPQPDPSKVPGFVAL